MFLILPVVFYTSVVDYEQMMDSLWYYSRTNAVVCLKNIHILTYSPWNNIHVIAQHVANKNVVECIHLMLKISQQLFLLLFVVIYYNWVE